MVEGSVGRPASSKRPEGPSHERKWHRATRPQTQGQHPAEEAADRPAGQDHSPRGCASSFDWMVSLIFMPVGQALAGPMAEVVGVDTVLVGAALLIAVPCFAVLPLRGIRHGPTLAEATGRAGEAGTSSVGAR